MASQAISRRPIANVGRSLGLKAERCHGLISSWTSKSHRPSLRPATEILVETTGNETLVLKLRTSLGAGRRVVAVPRPPLRLC
jgi:hypothetical protein